VIEIRQGQTSESHIALTPIGHDFCRLCPLGAGSWLVQQHRLERGTVNGSPISVSHRTLRMEQAPILQVHSANGASFVESCEEHQSIGSTAFRAYQELPIKDDATLLLDTRVRQV
jgi:hypothetical protein